MKKLTIITILITAFNTTKAQVNKDSGMTVYIPFALHNMSFKLIEQSNSISIGDSSIVFYNADMSINFTLKLSKEDYMYVKKTCSEFQKMIDHVYDVKRRRDEIKRIPVTAKNNY
jgi:hypothetical protein